MAQIATTPDTVPGTVAVARPTASRGAAALRLLLHNKVGAAGFVIFLVLRPARDLRPARSSPVIRRRTSRRSTSAPSSRHILGTDYEGRDVLHADRARRAEHHDRRRPRRPALHRVCRDLRGAQRLSLAAGSIRSILTIADMVLTIPYIILLGVLAAFIKLNSPILLAFIIAAVSWPTLLRAVRAQVLSLKEREYIEAARMLDLGTLHIIFREVIPNMMSYIVINFVIAMTSAIYGQIILYFLGLVPLAGDNWGLMINLAYTRGALFFRNSLWYILSPILAISLLQLSLVMISRSLEEIFNPRLREG